MTFSWSYYEVRMAYTYCAENEQMSPENVVLGRRSFPFKRDMLIFWWCTYCLFFPHVHLGIAIHREQHCPFALQFKRKPRVLYRLHHCCQDTVATAAAVAAKSLSRGEEWMRMWAQDYRLCFTRSIQILLYNKLTPLWRDFDRLAPFQAPVRCHKTTKHIKKTNQVAVAAAVAATVLQALLTDLSTSIKAWWHRGILKISSSWHGFWHP